MRQLISDNTGYEKIEIKRHVNHNSRGSFEESIEMIRDVELIWNFQIAIKNDGSCQHRHVNGLARSLYRETTALLLLLLLLLLLRFLLVLQIQRVLLPFLLVAVLRRRCQQYTQQALDKSHVALLISQYPTHVTMRSIKLLIINRNQFTHRCSLSLKRSLAKKILN